MPIFHLSNNIGQTPVVTNWPVFVNIAVVACSSDPARDRASDVM